MTRETSLKIGGTRVSYTTSQITYDAAQPNGHALAGVGAVSVTSLGARLCLADDPVDGLLVKVTPDGVAVVQVDGFAAFAAGDGGLPPNRGDLIAGDTLAAAPGYIKILVDPSTTGALLPFLNSPKVHEVVDGQYVAKL